MLLCRSASLLLLCLLPGVPRRCRSPLPSCPPCFAVRRPAPARPPRGGGKGIRGAATAEELRTGFINVQAEVPGSPIFLMQKCTKARHLEAPGRAKAC